MRALLMSKHGPNDPCILVGDGHGSTIEATTLPKLGMGSGSDGLWTNIETGIAIGVRSISGLLYRSSINGSVVSDAAVG